MIKNIRTELNNSDRQHKPSLKEMAMNIAVLHQFLVHKAMCDDKDLKDVLKHLKK